ncbi:hypothetical protein Tco_0520942 [Tanacetum coccineum]
MVVPFSLAIAPVSRIRLERPAMGKEVAIGDPKCYKCEKQGHYSWNYPTRKHDFLVDSDNEGERLEANVVFMSRLEKMKSFEVEHAHDAKTSGCDSLTDEALINHVYYATNNDSESDQDKLIHVLCTCNRLVEMKQMKEDSDKGNKDARDEVEDKEERSQIKEEVQDIVRVKDKNKGSGNKPKFREQDFLQPAQDKDDGA